MRQILLLCITLVTAGTLCAQNFSEGKMDSLFTILKQKDKYMGSIALSENGKIIYTNAVGFADIEAVKKADTQTRYRIGSVSKLFTATLVMKAVEEKKISLQQTLDAYFPKIKNSDKITIHQLLNHRSGIHNFTDDDEYLEYYTQQQTKYQTLTIIEKGNSDFEPDTKAAYSNSNYVLLGYILEKVYQDEYSVILNKKITKPLNLTNTFVGGQINPNKNEAFSYDFKETWLKEPETDLSIPGGAGALVSNPTDLVIFIEGLFNGKIISQKSLEIMKTIKDGYGSGMFELPNTGKSNYGHDGAIDRFNSLVTYLPADKLAIAIISNGGVYKNENILLCAVNSYYDKPFELPTFENLMVSIKILEQYTGEYSSEQLPIKITVGIDENQLTAQATGQKAFHLEASSETVFKFEKAGIVLEFDTQKNQMILKQAGKEFKLNKQ